MKTKLSITLVLMIVTNLLRAQIEVGAKLSGNIASMYYGNGHNSSYKLYGMSVGLLGEYSVNNCLGIRSELLYSTRGCKENIAMDDTGTKKGTFLLKYIDIPILAKFRFYKRFNVQLGTQFGFCVGNSIKIGGEYYNELASSNFFDLGLVGGLGYDFKNGLFVDARYVHGLTHSYKNMTDDWQHRVWQFSAGYKIKWKGNK